MIIAGMYSFKNGREVIESEYSWALDEIRAIITAIDSEQYRTKISKEKTMTGRVLYSPVAINKAIKAEFAARDWKNQRVICEYPMDYYTDAYVPPMQPTAAFREMDFTRERVGVEVQLVNMRLWSITSALK